MVAECISPDSAPSSPTCYFSLTFPHSNPSEHFSDETPSISPVSAYSPDVHSQATNPLLAHRHLSDHMTSPTDTSSLLQLQTSAAHRPTAMPLQNRSSTSSGRYSPSSSSDSSSTSSSSMASSTLCCSRCRRESRQGMVQFGTNTYYCNHCARMTGYCKG